jgi:hypothetical protein
VEGAIRRPVFKRKKFTRFLQQYLKNGGVGGYNFWCFIGGEEINLSL